MQKFLSELKRRHVHKVAIGYAALAWFVLEVSDFVFPRLGIPDAAINFVLIVAAIGFPIAIILSWIFDLTDAGIVRTAAIPESELPSLRPSHLAQILLIFSLVVVIAFLMLERQSDPQFVKKSGYTIGVLPFKNITAEANNEYFSDGISEEILNALVGIQELKVASRTSSFYFKNTKESAQQIGKKLAVRLLLVGSVSLAGDKVRITAQLIDTSDGFNIWSDIYNGELKNVFSLQNKIAQQVVSSVTPVINAELALRAYNSDNVRAYDHYLRGRDYLRQSPSDANLKNAEQQFEEAIKRDPAFVQAYAGLCQTKLEVYRLRRSTSDFESAEKSCNRAVTRQGTQTKNWELNLALGELYRAVGQDDESLKQIDESLNQIDAAIALRGDLPVLYISKAKTLVALNRHNEALRAFKQAVEVNPGEWESHLELANYYYHAPQPDYDSAIASYQKVLELVPGYARALIGMGSVYYMAGQPDEAERAWLQAEETTESIGNLAILYSNRGLTYYYEEKFLEAVEMQRNALRLIPEEHKYWGRLAESYRALGDPEEEKKAYQRAIEHASEAENINPRDWETLGLLSLYWAHSDDPAEALRYQQKLLEVAANNSTAFYFAALSSLAIDDDEQALHYLKQAAADESLLEILGNDPDLAELRVRQPDKFAELLKQP